MIADRPSATAQRVAVRRAQHQIVDHPRVFDDPIAARIIGFEAAAELTSAGTRESPGSRSLRAFVVARSRFAEDELAKAVEWGVRQCVILGAGLDTFSYRNPYPDLRAFEVDHPATQAWKQKRLESAGIAIPSSMTFVPVDFERQKLDAELANAGFHVNEPAFFSWLGVTPYLNIESVTATLQLIHSMSDGNGVVFDYAVPRASLNWPNRIAFDMVASRVAKAGEPFRGFFEPDQLVRDLRAIGFRTVEDLSPETINLRFFSGRADKLRVRGSLGHLLYAGV